MYEYWKTVMQNMVMLYVEYQADRVRFEVHGGTKQIPLLQLTTMKCGNQHRALV